MLSPDDELEIACLVGVGTSCRALELLSKAMIDLREERDKVKALEEWIRSLDRQNRKWNRST